MVSNVKKSGQRIGDWFLWIECEIAKTDSYRKIPVVTLRHAVSGGDILSTVVASKEMADQLRNAADQIERVISSTQDMDSTEAAQ